MAEAQPDPCFCEEDRQEDISAEVSVSCDDAYSEDRQHHRHHQTLSVSSTGGGDDGGGSLTVPSDRQRLEEDQNGTLWEAEKGEQGIGERMIEEEEAKEREEVEEKEEGERKEDDTQRKEEKEEEREYEEDEQIKQEERQGEEEREEEQKQRTEKLEENSGGEGERRKEKMPEVKRKTEDRKEVEEKNCKEDNVEQLEEENREATEKPEDRGENENKVEQQVSKEDDGDGEKKTGEHREEEAKEEEEEAEDRGEEEGVEERREEEDEEEEEEEDTSDTTGDEEEEVDPRVAENLEILNQSCAEVNRLENELDEARSKYRSTFQASSQRMEELGAKIKKSIQRARHYYELTDKAKQAQNEALRAARQFQSANGTYRAAMEMVTLAEKGLQDDVTANKAKTLTSAWQETLSHAVQRLTEAEREKSVSEAEHNKKAAACAQLEAQIHVLEKKYKRSIAKARPYFETKAELELKLQQQKQNVWDLQSAISTRKARYSEALRCLEQVSTEIHETRRARKRMLLQYPREPGVGAETDSVGSSISDNNSTIERGVFSTSSSFYPEEDDEGEESDGEANDVFSTHSGSSSDLRKQTLVRSMSRRSVTQPRRQGKEQDEAEDEGVGDSASVCSQVSGRSDFSRSVSGASVFSSEGELSSNLPDSPTSLSSSPSSKIHTVANPHSFSGEERAVSHHAAPSSLMDMACGGVGQGARQPPCIGRDSSSSLSSECKGEGGLGGEKDMGGAAPASQEEGSCKKSQSLEFPSERGTGDGSAQEDTLKESSTTKQMVTVSSQLSSTMSSAPPPQHNFPQQQMSKNQSKKAKASTKSVKSTSTSLMTVSGVVSSPAAVIGEVKKAPLRRTDVNSHRPLQGVMLLNPLDLAASSMGGTGPRF